MSLAIVKNIRSSVKFDEAAMQTGGDVSKQLLRLPESMKNAAFEIRIRCGQPIAITTTDGTYIPYGDKLISRVQMNDTFANICGNAVYSHQTEIAHGCVTLVGGHRAGICGRAVRSTESTQSITDISSICIRIAHEVIGCAHKLVKVFHENSSNGLLIAGPPCSGKTTLLRDMARSLAENRNVAIVDERNEIAAVYRGVPQLDIGCRSDVLTGQVKSVGMLHAVTCLSPDVLICDEIGSIQEAEAVRMAFNAGVSVIAAMHCGDMGELARREQFRLLRGSGAFAKVAVLDKGMPGSIAHIADINAI